MNDHNKMMANQDDCLIAMSGGKIPPREKLRALPPWRAVLIARVALVAGLITADEVGDLVQEASLIGGGGHLSP